jgi:hypothetical protein
LTLIPDGPLTFEAVKAWVCLLLLLLLSLSLLLLLLTMASLPDSFLLPDLWEQGPEDQPVPEIIKHLCP